MPGQLQIERLAAAFLGLIQDDGSSHSNVVVALQPHPIAVSHCRANADVGVVGLLQATFGYILRQAYNVRPASSFS